MRTLRIFFAKTGEAAYISHLDLQRVFARALRRSGLPVWYSQGFNPHIYMSFALPLSLGQESVCEAVDCRTEAEGEDFAAYTAPLDEALPKGIEVQRITFPQHAAGEIAAAVYHIRYPGAAGLAAAVQRYNALPAAMVVRKTKRSQQEIDLKLPLPTLQLLPDEPGQTAGPALAVQLPAGGESNLNPALLCGFLEEQFGLPAGEAAILRKAVLLADGRPFC